MKTVLLIEDNQEVRENIAEILELSHYNVVQADNGKTGVELAQQVNPDLIICDIMMPVLDGYGVIHLLNKTPRTAGIPFIFLTAKSERGDFRKGMEMGADDYITKPFDDVELLRAVEGRLKKNEMLKAEYSKNIEGLSKFFEEVEEKELIKKFSGGQKIKMFKKKEVVFNEGNLPNYLFFLNKGKVKTFKHHEYGKELITTLYKDGEFFGHVALLEECEYPETAECLEDSEIYMVPKEDFYNLVYSNPEVNKKFIQMLSNDVMEKEEQLVNLAYSSVRKRVAEALVLLEERYRKPGDEKFSMAISRDDLANIVGTATESLIRTLSDFKEEKMLEIKGSSITILDLNRLKTLKA